MLPITLCVFLLYLFLLGWHSDRAHAPDESVFASLGVSLRGGEESVSRCADCVVCGCALLHLWELFSGLANRLVSSLLNGTIIV